MKYAHENLQNLLSAYKQRHAPSFRNDGAKGQFSNRQKLLQIFYYSKQKVKDA